MNKKFSTVVGVLALCGSVHSLFAADKIKTMAAVLKDRLAREWKRSDEVRDSAREMSFYPQEKLVKARMRWFLRENPPEKIDVTKMSSHKQYVKVEYVAHLVCNYALKFIAIEFAEQSCSYSHRSSLRGPACGKSIWCGVVYDINFRHRQA